MTLKLPVNHYLCFLEWGVGFGLRRRLQVRVYSQLLRKQIDFVLDTSRTNTASKFDFPASNMNSPKLMLARQLP